MSFTADVSDGIENEFSLILDSLNHARKGGFPSKSKFTKEMVEFIPRLFKEYRELVEINRQFVATEQINRRIYTEILTDFNRLKEGFSQIKKIASKYREKSISSNFNRNS